MNSKTCRRKTCRRKTCLKRKPSKCLHLATDSKKLDCQCPMCLSGKRYVRCIRSSRLRKSRLRRKQKGGNDCLYITDYEERKNCVCPLNQYNGDEKAYEECLHSVKEPTPARRD